jgi:hypothetical protein
MKQVTGIVAASVLVAAVAHASPAQSRPAATARRSQLRAVRVQPARDSIQIVFVLDGPARYKSARSARPPRITIDIFETTISPLLTHREFLSDHAALIRVLLVRSAGTTRAILDLAAAGTHTVYYAAGTRRLVVQINALTREPVAPAKRTVAPATPTAQIGTGPTAAPRIAEHDATPPASTIRIPWVARRPQIGDFTADWSLPDGVRVGGFRQR